MKELIEKLQTTRHEYHYDAGHAWLKVKKPDLIALDIEDQITGYSYAYSGNVYLEEDLDAITYLKALFPNGFDTPEFQDFKAMFLKEINDGDISTIRSFPHYK